MDQSGCIALQSTSCNRGRCMIARGLVGSRRRGSNDCRATCSGHKTSASWRRLWNGLHCTVHQSSSAALHHDRRCPRCHRGQQRRQRRHRTLRQDVALAHWHRGKEEPGRRRLRHCAAAVRGGCGAVLQRRVVLNAEYEKMSGELQRHAAANYWIAAFGQQEEAAGRRRRVGSKRHIA